MTLPEVTREDEEHWGDLMDQEGPTEGATYLRPLAALALFDQSEKRVQRDNGWIKIEGKWLQMSRTDLKDDVRIGRYWAKGTEDKEIIAYYRAKIRWGARLTHRLWCSIDAYSDG